MLLHDLLPLDQGGQVDADVSVEPAGPQQSLVQHVGPVGAGQQDHVGGGAHAVHLHQQLVQGLLALGVGGAHAAAALGSLLANGVNLVNEDDTRSTLPGLGKQTADPAGAQAADHLDKLGPVHGQEGNIGLVSPRVDDDLLHLAPRQQVLVEIVPWDLYDGLVGLS